MASATVTVTAAAYVDVVALSGLSGKLMIQNRERSVKNQGKHVVAIKPVLAQPSASAEVGVLLGPMGDVTFDGEANLWARSLSGADIDVEVVEAV